MYEVTTWFNDGTFNFMKTKNYEKAFEFLNEDRTRHLSFTKGEIRKDGLIRYAVYEETKK